LFCPWAKQSQAELFNKSEIIFYVAFFNFLSFSPPLLAFIDAGYLALGLDSGQLISMGDKSLGQTFTDCGKCIFWKYMICVCMCNMAV